MTGAAWVFIVAARAKRITLTVFGIEQTGLRVFITGWRMISDRFLFSCDDPAAQKWGMEVHCFAA
jgi:hypothetical protein